MNPESPADASRQRQKLPPLQRGQGLERMQRQQKLTSQLKQHSLNLKLEQARIVRKDPLPELELLRRMDSEG